MDLGHVGHDRTRNVRDQVRGTVHATRASHTGHEVVTRAEARRAVRANGSGRGAGKDGDKDVAGRDALRERLVGWAAASAP